MKRELIAKIGYWTSFSNRNKGKRRGIYLAEKETQLTAHKFLWTVNGMANFVCDYSQVFRFGKLTPRLWFEVNLACRDLTYPPLSQIPANRESRKSDLCIESAKEQPVLFSPWLKVLSITSYSGFPILTEGILQPPGGQDRSLRWQFKVGCLS